MTHVEDAKGKVATLDTPPPGIHALHPTALVDPAAVLEEGVTVGPYSIIDAGARIGAGTKIGAHVAVSGFTRIGKECRIFHGAVLGSEPQDIKYAGETTHLEIGDRTIIREYATLNRGTTDRKKTVVGSDCFLMAYSHVAHDCRVGDHVILANSVNMAGHVTIDDWAVVGGVVPIHQFVHIGCHAMIGGGFRVPQDVCPYALLGGYPLAVVGLNIVGLKRRGFTSAQLGPLRRAFRLLFGSGLNTTQALDRIDGEIERTAEIAILVDFIRASARGITK
jgi:UDP-N-acetylglucosamine acyltransferase